MATPREAVEVTQVPQALLEAAAAAGEPAATRMVQRAQRQWSHLVTPTMMVTEAAAALQAAHLQLRLRLPTALHLAMAAAAVAMGTATAARVQQLQAALTVMQARSLPLPQLQQVATTPQAPPVPGLLFLLQAIGTALGSTTAAVPLRTGQLTAPTAMPVDTDRMGVVSCTKYCCDGTWNVAAAVRSMPRPHCVPSLRLPMNLPDPPEGHCVSDLSFWTLFVI